MARDDIISLLAAIIGALIGALVAGLWGVIGGVIIAWVIPFILLRVTEEYRLKKQILLTLSNTSATQVRDVMAKHGIQVPIDSFEYDEKSSFVKSLAKYRRLLSELEHEGKVRVSPQASVSHGYVNPPNDWVNEWSGRAFIKAT